MDPCPHRHGRCVGVTPARIRRVPVVGGIVKRLVDQDVPQRGVVLHDVGREARQPQPAHLLARQQPEAFLCGEASDLLHVGGAQLRGVGVAALLAFGVLDDES